MVRVVRIVYRSKHRVAKPGFTNFQQKGCAYGDKREHTARAFAIIENMEKIKVEHHTPLAGLWAAAWLFTIGYLQLSFWQGVLAVLIWPYYLGAWLRAAGY